MAIRLNIEKRIISLSGLEQSLATGAYTREALHSEFLRQISLQPPYYHIGLISIHEATLRMMIVKYSEQLVFQPLNEIRHWFAYSGGAYIEPGYPPLFYSRNRNRTVSPNKSAVAGIGEGIAGFISQRLYMCRKLARPNHDFPDIVMESGGATYLVESKATLSDADGVRWEIEDELPRMAAFAASCAQIDTRPVIGLLIGTAIVNETNYHSHVIEVRLI